MALFKKPDLGKLKGTLESGVQTAQNAVSNIKIDDVVRGAKGAADAAASKAAEAGKALGSGIESARDGIANFKVEDAVQGVKDATKGGASAVGKAIESVSKKAPEEEGESSPLRNYIALLWCLVYADGEVTDAEKKAFDELSRTLDESYVSYSAELMQEYELAIQASRKEFGLHNAVKIEAQRIIESLEPSPEDAKLICWNLLALAISDGLDESEIDFIRFVGEKSDVDPAVFAELKNYADAVVEIEESIEALKQSGRSYGEIEPLVTEFAKREQTIVEAAQALIADR